MDLRVCAVIGSVLGHRGFGCRIGVDSALLVAHRGRGGTRARMWLRPRRARGHAGPYCLAGGRLVGERDHAVRRGGRGEELQRELLPAAASRYRTNQHRVNGELDFVDEMALEQGLAKSAVP
jgi:hypothetical protein